MSKPKKLFYLIASKDYFYCVPTKDLKTAVDHSVQVNDSVAFMYNTLSLTGTVRFISSKEGEVMDEIKKERKLLKKKEASFHAERPRMTASRQRQLMKNSKPHDEDKVKIKQEKEDTRRESKAESKKCAKIKVKNLKASQKAAAENLTEQIMISQVSASQSKPSAVRSDDLSHEDTGSDKDVLHDDNNNNDSSSSISEPNLKVNKAMKRRDINQLKDLDDIPSEDETAAVAPPGPASSTSITKCPPVPGASISGPQQHLSGTSPSVAVHGPGAAVGSVDGGKVVTAHKPDVVESLSCSEEIDPTVPIGVHGCDGTPDDNSKSALSDSSDGKRHFKSRVKRSRSTSSSSSSSSSSSTSSSSESSDSEEEEDRKKRLKKSRKSSKRSKKTRKSKKRGKKSKKYRKRTESSSCDSSEEERSSHRRRSTKRRIRRNMDIYPGENFKWKESDPGVVRVHADYPVYIQKSELDDALTQAKSPQTFIKLLTGHVFTSEALKGSTAQGYPSRNKGSRKMRQEDVLPRIDPEGRRAIIKRAEELENERKSWRPRIGLTAMNHAFTQAVGRYT